MALTLTQKNRTPLVNINFNIRRAYISRVYLAFLGLIHQPQFWERFVKMSQDKGKEFRTSPGQKIVFPASIKYQQLIGGYKLSTFCSIASFRKDQFIEYKSLDEFLPHFLK